MTCYLTCCQATVESIPIALEVLSGSHHVTETSFGSIDQYILS